MCLLQAGLIVTLSFRTLPATLVMPTSSGQGGQEKGRSGDVSTAVVAYLLGTATAGAALLARMVLRKLRRRRRVVRSGRGDGV